jgi:Flp pilus assembly protein TadG
MRVTDRVHEDRGAVAVMVALMLVVLLGMLALVIDLGRAVGIRREMVNAADAAALAAAQQCALNMGPAAATAAANETATLNDPAAGPVAIAIDPECVPGAVSSTDPKTVTVTYSRTVDYFVAPILGFDSGTVTTSATAIWGAATRAAPIPLRINLSSLAECGIDVGEAPAGQTCYLGYANNDPYEAANDWGWLYFGGQDGRGWNTTSCSSQAGGSNDPIGFIQGQPFFNAQLNDPPPTYVCSYSGNAQNVVGALQGRVGDVLTFPVVDATTYPVLGKGANLAWPVVTFIGLRLDAVYDQPGASQYCPELVDQRGQDEFCLRLSYVGTVPGGGIPGDAIYFNVPAVRLVE